MHVRDPRFWLFTMMMLAGTAAPLSAATLNVAVGGIDADGCGTKAAPCRSISRAIFDAAPGDKILVGPGRYGDLDADGTFGEPGEESGSGAAVRIDKPLIVESVEGAATTMIDLAGANLIGVRISASGVQLGKAKKGFTITRSNTFGVIIDVGTTGVVVSGIRAVKNRTGFASKSDSVTFRGNVADANTQNGFALGGPATVTGCRATGNTLIGFSIGGNGSVVKGNVAAGNGDAGFDLLGDTIALTGSVAAGNTIGLRILEGTGLVVSGNSFLGNTDVGVLVGAPALTISKSNIFGNGATGGNCGVTTIGAGAVTLDEICFGSPTGPGDDPLDLVCGGGPNLVLETKKEFKVTPKVPL